MAWRQGLMTGQNGQVMLQRFQSNLVALERTAEEEEEAGDPERGEPEGERVPGNGRRNKLFKFD